MPIRRPLRTPAPYLVFLLVLALGCAALVPGRGLVPGFLAAFSVGSGVYVLITMAALARAGPEELAAHAAFYEPSWLVRLVLTLVILAAVTAAIGVELARGTQGGRPLALTTLAAAWVFANMAFAGHYAHLYYRPGAPPQALAFPGGQQPDFWDFCYFAFVLGMTFQVSDVAIQDRMVRRQALVHGLFAFTFNVGGLALAVNLLAAAA